MKERPILFSGPMVRAILAGTKTQTRRVAETRLDGETTADGVTTSGYEPDPRKGWGRVRAGDRLWVREAVRREGEPDGEERWCPSSFIADGAPTIADCWPWKNKALPAIHMPRGFCRIVLEVTSIRVERLQDITEEDAKAEGVEPLKCIADDQQIIGRCIADGGSQYKRTQGTHPYTLAFAVLWDTINDVDGKRWIDNPWLWVVSFKRVEPTP